MVQQCLWQRLPEDSSGTAGCDFRIFTIIFFSLTVFKLLFFSVCEFGPITGCTTVDQSLLSVWAPDIIDWKTLAADTHPLSPSPGVHWLYIYLLSLCSSFSPGSSVMFRCSGLSTPLYPSFLPPPSAFSPPSSRFLSPGFLLEDVLALSRPGSALHRTLTSTIPGPDSMPLRPLPVACVRAAAPSSSSGSPHRTSPNSGLKFGVNAILAPSTRSSGEKN